MKILLLGSGGREHAIAYKLCESALCEELYIAPGNAGTLDYGENLSFAATDFESVRNAVIENKIDLVVVGPEEPLVNGIVDFFQNDPQLKNVLIVGPSAAGARLEGSKDFAKAFMQRHEIPTALYRTFDKNSLEDGKQFINSLKPPYVLKADGLAAGKGVIISESAQEASDHLESMLAHSMFGKASEKVVIEQFLDGIELSVFVLTDGNDYVILPEAKDYKRVGEGDAGPNTGGMGAVSPVPFADAAFMEKVEERIVKPTVAGLRQENIYYRGFIFIGLMKVDNEPYVIEYNVRLGDPETEVVLPRIRTDLVKLLCSVAAGRLDKNFSIDDRTAVTVMLTSKGYPGKFEKGKLVQIKSSACDCIIFHAGTTYDGGDIITTGGRVIAVTAFGKTIEDALVNSYRQVENIQFENKYFRKDIGVDLMELNL